MKRRLRFIFSLLALCLLGVYGFQAYWLYGSYQLAQADFARTVREALEAVVQRQQLAHANKTFNIKFNNYAAPGTPADRAPRWQIESLDTSLTPLSAPHLVKVPARPPTVLVVRPLGQRRLLGTTSPVLSQTEQARAAHTDSLAYQLSNFVIKGWYRQLPVNLPLLTHLYRAELHQRGTEADFQLDTLSAQSQPAYQLSAPGTKGPVAVRVMPSRAGYPVHTPPVQLNPVRGPWVGASFRPPTAFVLRRMAGGLINSLALLGLTTGCFALMLSTILRQKKLAEIRSDFINNMTHELKTPLATVSAAVEALQDFGALADARKTDAYLTMARQELRRLADLVDKVLHIAVEDRPGQALPLHPEPVRPAELVAGLVRRHQLQATKPVRFEVEISPLDTLLADRLHLAGALDNLLDNALKYSGERVRIGLRGRPAAGSSPWPTMAPASRPATRRPCSSSFFACQRVICTPSRVSGWGCITCARWWPATAGTCACAPRRAGAASLCSGCRFMG